MPVTADTITDEQIRELRELSSVWLDRAICTLALGERQEPADHRVVQDWPGSRHWARGRCAEILNARAEVK